jgi:hypothetical protein
VAAGDPTESHDLDEAADRFEEAAAAGAELTHHLGGASWAVEAGLADHALGVRHQEAFRRVATQYRGSRNQETLILNL